MIPFHVQYKDRTANIETGPVYRNCIDLDYLVKQEVLLRAHISVQ
jgi:hypothetical protein